MVKFGILCFYMWKTIRQLLNGNKITANDQCDRALSAFHISANFNMQFSFQTLCFALNIFILYDKAKLNGYMDHWNGIIVPGSYIACLPTYHVSNGILL